MFAHITLQPISWSLVIGTCASVQFWSSNYAYRVQRHHHRNGGVQTHTIICYLLWRLLLLMFAYSGHRKTFFFFFSGLNGRKIFCLFGKAFLKWMTKVNIYYYPFVSWKTKNNTTKSFVFSVIFGQTATFNAIHRIMPYDKTVFVKWLSLNWNRKKI